MPRFFAGLGLGVVGGLLSAPAEVCFHRKPCGWDFEFEAAVYWTGTVVGAAMVSGERCSFASRLGRSFLGALPGTVLGLGVAKAGHGTQDGAAVATTLVAGLAPLAGSVIALRSCD